MYVINPITIDDDVFIGSNVTENDAAEYDPTSAYTEGNDVMVATSTANVHKTYECITAQYAGLTADILYDDCSDLSSWTDNDTGTGVSEVSPAGQFRFDTNAGAAGNYIASRYRTIASPPDTFTLEIEAYFDSIGAYGNSDYFLINYGNANWRLYIRCYSDGLFIMKAGAVLAEVGTNILKSGSTAAWQKLRLQVDKTTESSATVEVFLDDESQGTVDCDYEPGSGTDGQIVLSQYGYATDNMVTHLNSIKVATGLGKIVSVGDSPVDDNINWLDTGSTNRWKAFNGILGSQMTEIDPEYIFQPGATFNSLALLNMTDVDTVTIITSDLFFNLVANGENWIGASGTTPPTGWDNVGTPADFTIEDGKLKITTDADNEGISQTITVIPETEYQLFVTYRTSSGGSQYLRLNVYDVSNSADIIATYDLSQALKEDITVSKIFTAPSGCSSIKVSLLVKTSGGYGHFDSVICAPTDYNKTEIVGSAKKNLVLTDLPGTSTHRLTVTFGSGRIFLGELIVGNKTYIGVGPLEDAQGGFTNYSDFNNNAFGELDLVKRSYKKQLSFELEFDYADLDTIYDFLCDNKDTMMLYLGSETYGALQIYGFCKEPIITYKTGNCIMALETRGVI
jgi:hypothetical protein